MSTNVSVDTKLAAKAKKLGGFKSKREAVNEALAEFVRRRKPSTITELFGKIDYDPNYDYKKMRQR